MKTCSVEGCDRRADCNGICWTHVRRLRKGGSVDYVSPPRTGAANHAWRGDEVCYKDAHGRVYRRRGPARDHACVKCGKQARQWAYNHQDPNEKHDPDGGWAYSADPAFYEPMCVPCHKRMDLDRLAEAASWTALAVRPACGGVGGCNEKTGGAVGAARRKAKAS